MMLKARTQGISAARAPAAARPAVLRAGSPAARRGAAPRAADEKKEPPPESFQESSGFVAYDSAGQSNMYPVFTKAYAGPAPPETASANNGFAITAAAVAIGAIVVGLFALTNSGGDTVNLADYKTLSEYATIFSGEL
ncbi:hypothetical protein Rsub_07026 [Raphidocelis subcapitata]|uniref:Uncharacterized protein n=1 Tax=Raphidocelis subcapitata TaxID=307507 RepID=A0A2V0P6E4_9CHLO|nr:hypothetical protein Rsub_07026 [Raphidocelis subcapitata]|eukprot:GBF94492.1 hypothetical protein Rsub_07026 [Raphidocelis subcapitata]